MTLAPAIVGCKLNTQDFFYHFFLQILWIITSGYKIIRIEIINRRNATVNREQWKYFLNRKHYINELTIIKQCD
jgi:hypothetical protein